MPSKTGLDLRLLVTCVRDTDDPAGPDMSLCIALPVFNEERRLPTTLGQLHPFLEQHFAGPWEIVIANNGSTDATLELARLLARNYSRVQVVHLDLAGRGRALKQAWLGSRTQTAM